MGCNYDATERLVVRAAGEPAPFCPPGEHCLHETTRHAEIVWVSCCQCDTCGPIKSTAELERILAALRPASEGERDE